MRCVGRRRPPRRRRRQLLATSLAAALLAGCTSRAKSEAPLPPRPPVVVVTMREHTLDYYQPVPAGRVVFRFVNRGRFPHRPALVPLPEHLPPIHEQLRGTTRAVLAPFAGVATVPPGETGSFAVNLVADTRYAIVDFARGPDGQSFAREGMASDFRAGGPPPPPGAPGSGGPDDPGGTG